MSVGGTHLTARRPWLWFWPFCVEFACSPCACVGSRWVLWASSYSPSSCTRGWSAPLNCPLTMWSVEGGWSLCVDPAGCDPSSPQHSRHRLQQPPQAMIESVCGPLTLSKDGQNRGQCGGAKNLHSIDWPAGTAKNGCKKAQNTYLYKLFQIFLLA